MSGNEIRQKYLDYMAKNGHAIIPSAALVPQNDPTTLFTGSGMQPLVPYLMGERHPKGTRLSDSQKCFRADDIEEVGDNRHTTFFEMLGNWSLGDYFKKEQLPWFYAFIVDEVGLDPKNIYVTVFAGSEADSIPRDDESASIWQGLFLKRGVSNGVAYIGSEADGGRRGIHEDERIFFYDSAKNWWSRAGKPENMPVGEIGGPDSEMFYDFGTTHDTKFGEFCHPNCDCGRFLEIGNSVFMEYIKTETGFEKLPHQNVDFGGGLERIAAARNGDPDMFKIDLLYRIIMHLEKLSHVRYEDNTLAFRIIADHIRGAVFMIADGILPSNTEQGYFVRRLLRRSVRYADTIHIAPNELKELARIVIATYHEYYTELSEKEETIINTIAAEEEQFRKTLEHGLKQFNRISIKAHLTLGKDTAGKPVVTDSSTEKFINGKNAFELFTTYGFPIELTEEIAHERGMQVDIPGFKKLMEEHRALSRQGAEHKFKGGLADNSDKVIAYHTATHLLLAGLKKELGANVHQAGSNITSERLRFDFTHPHKVDAEILQRVEKFVNDAIHAGAHVSTETLPKTVAEQDPTIEGSFWDRYPDEVKVYTITDGAGNIYSRELCGGPHVQNTQNIEGTFHIVKEEASSQGIRRIKAVLT